MARETYVLRNGKLVPKHRAAPRTGGYVISDSMDATWHPGDGRRYDSKSQFRRATRALGFREVGNDADRKREREKLPPVGPDVKQAIEQLRAGHRPEPLERAAIPGGEDRAGRYGAIPLDRILRGR